MLQVVTERQLEILGQQPHYELVAQFLTLCMAKGTAVLGHLQSSLVDNEEIQRIIMSVEKDSLHDEVLNDPKAEWLGIINRVEVETLKQMLGAFTSADLKDEEKIKRYRQLSRRLNNLRNVHN